MPRALLSVSDKTGVVDFGRGLAARGYELISTGGTAHALMDAGLPVTSVSALTGFPEMMDGRVKTLHPKIHGGILARRDHPDDLAAAAAQGIGLIDLVVVNLYPFAQTAAKPGVTFDELLEQIDIGGPSMVRAAAKNFRDVLVVVQPTDYARLLEALDAGPTYAFRYELMVKAFAHTAEYDSTITSTLLRINPDYRPTVETPDRLDLSLVKIQDLKYGENPHQLAAWYRAADAAQSASHAGFGGATIHQGREVSFTNLLDLDAAARIVLEFDEPAAAVVKHTNPCGVATGTSAADAYVRARDADRLSSFGGIVALNRVIDIAAARAITETKIDAVIALAVDDAAREILGRKSNMRVVTADFGESDRPELEFSSILGAVLAQERDVVVEAREVWTPEALPKGFLVVSRRQPTNEEWEGLRFAWRVCAHVKSNAVVFTNREQTLAIGAGQMSRVDAGKVAVMMARNSKDRLKGSVAATDGFFPFRDGVDAIAQAGATAVIHPGGSLRDAEVIAAADEHGLAMVFTGRRHFRH